MILDCSGTPIPFYRVHRFSPTMQDQPSHYDTLTPFHGTIHCIKQASPVVDADLACLEKLTINALSNFDSS
jgi:hypothetical protein